MLDLSEEMLKRLRIHVKILCSFIYGFLFLLNLYTPAQASGTFKDVQLQPLERVDKSIPYELVPTQHEYETSLIRISQVVLDWEQQNILISLDGIHGEPYILRLSQDNTNIVMEEQMFVQEADMTININATFIEGLEYSFALFDYYNECHSTFTWRQPMYFEAWKAIVTPEYIDVPPTPLAKTNDRLNNPIFYSALLCMISSVIIIQMLKWGRRSA